MQFVTYFWSVKWYNIYLRFCAYNSQLSLNLVYRTHFAGLKPWNIRREKSLLHYCKFDDYKMWYRVLHEMVELVYPLLKAMPKIKRLLWFYKKNLLDL